MSAGIDHVAKAADLLVVTVEDTPEGYARKVAVAQAHAMLTLVEQQRIANLIALWSVNDTSYSATAFEALGSMSAEWGGRAELYPHIKEALGIE